MWVLGFGGSELGAFQGLGLRGWRLGLRVFEIRLGFGGLELGAF